MPDGQSFVPVPSVELFSRPNGRSDSLAMKITLKAYPLAVILPYCLLKLVKNCGRGGAAKFENGSAILYIIWVQARFSHLESEKNEKKLKVVQSGQYSVGILSSV